jgi:fructose 1,6-bisphosphatase
MCAAWAPRWWSWNSRKDPTIPSHAFDQSGAYNLPLYLAFADPMTTPGLTLSPSMATGFRFVIKDVAGTVR